MLKISTNWRRTKIVFSIFFFLLTILLIIYGALYLFSSPAPEDFRLMARDWTSIEFTTDLKNNPINQPTYAVDISGGGILEGEAQYIFSSMTGGGIDGIHGAEDLHVKNTKTVIFDVSEWEWFVEFDQDNALYYILLRNDEEVISYYPPFEDIPEQLVDSIVYVSTQDENLALSTPPSGQPIQTLSRYHLLTNEPMPFSWNLRKGCNVEIKHLYDTRSKTENGLAFAEECPPNRSFSFPYEEEADENAKFEFSSFQTPIGNGKMLVVPASLTLSVDGFGELTDTGKDYLLLIGNDNITTLESYPQGLQKNFIAYLLTNESNLNEPLVDIVPNTTEVVFSQPIGKIAVGLDSYATDELSEVRVTFTESPKFAWDNQVITDQDGADKVTQFLSGKGIVEQVRFNGNNLITTRWDNLPEEIQGATVAAIFGAFGWVVVTLLRMQNEQQKKDKITPSKKDAPGLLQNGNVEPPMESSKSPVQVKNKKIDIRGIVALSIGILIGFVLFWRRPPQ